MQQEPGSSHTFSSGFRHGNGRGKRRWSHWIDAKDPNELHKKNWKGFKAAFQQALDGAQPLGGAHTQPALFSSDYIPAPFTLQELLARQLPPIQWAIPDILPEGLTLLAGKPKLGKSWLALAMALAVAAGGVALGTYPSRKGRCSTWP